MILSSMGNPGWPLMCIMEIYYVTAGEYGLICPQNLSKKLRLICNKVKKRWQKYIHFSKSGSNRIVDWCLVICLWPEWSILNMITHGTLNLLEAVHILVLGFASKHHKSIQLFVHCYMNCVSKIMPSVSWRHSIVLKNSTGLSPLWKVPSVFCYWKKIKHTLHY